MSIEAMNWALNVKTGAPSTKSVLLILANRADHQGRCWPGIDGIAEQTELSRRSVIQHIQKLEQCKLLTVEHRGGSGEGRKSNVYVLHIGQCADFSHRGNVQSVHGQCAVCAGQCAAGAPEPTINPQKNPKTIKQRPTRRAPKSFTLDDQLIAFAVERGMTDSVMADQLGQFRDHEFKTPRRDWPAAWRTWVRNWQKWGTKAAPISRYDLIVGGLS